MCYVLYGVMTICSITHTETHSACSGLSLLVSLSVVRSPTSPGEFHCSFEEEPICMFSQDQNDDFDWTRHSAATRDTKYTPNTGPSGDRSGSKQGEVAPPPSVQPHPSSDCQQPVLCSPHLTSPLLCVPRLLHVHRDVEAPQGRRPGATAQPLLQRGAQKPLRHHQPSRLLLELLLPHVRQTHRYGESAAIADLSSAPLCLHHAGDHIDFEQH